jgi:autotransporter-associated beta strand protein
MKLKSTLLYSAMALAISSAQAADVTFDSDATYNDTQTYDNGFFGGGDGRRITFENGANYTFSGSITIPLAWHHITLNSGASLNVAGGISSDVSGLSLNGGVLTTSGLQLHDSPFWAGTFNDGKQTIEPGDSIINGSTIIASQSNANFITLAGGTGGINGWVANNLWIGNDGAIINSNGFNIGVTMALGNFTGQTGSLTKNGAGILTLSTNNSYTGGTTINAGTLEIAGSNAGNGFIRGVVNVNTGAELRYTGGDGTGFGFNVGNKIDTININGGLVNSQGSMTHVWGATINMTGGELRSNGGVSSQDGLRMEWNNSTVNTLASAETALISGRINLRAEGNYNALVFDVANGAASTDLLVSAAVTQASVVGITKNGAGTMVMSGNSNYTGATNVNAGTLVINGNISTSNVTVQSGATLGGSGTVGSLTVNEGATINPGNSPGILNVNGAYNQAGTLIAEITGTTAGSGYDQINVTGSVNLSGALTLDVTNAGTGYMLNSMIFLILNDAVDAVTGAFSNYAQGTNVGNFGGFDWVISYEADSSNNSFTGGNDVALRAIPEPSAALLGGLGLVGLMRRRRRAC